tara:strand:+ start:1289 stop:1690 length:402 start_codon:yes stop_codon:yes gene_type:complete
MLDIKIVNIFISGLVSGIILYQSIVVAGTAFKFLETNQVSIFLRSIFPKFFKFISVFGIISFILNIIFKTHLYLIVISCLTVVLALTCLMIIPKTNRAKDENDTSLFQLLHTISVLLTILILILNISLIFNFI